MSFVRQTMFDSVVRQLFGADNLPQSEADMRELEHNFVKFDEDFEYGTQLPDFIIRSTKILSVNLEYFVTNQKYIFIQGLE